MHQDINIYLTHLGEGDLIFCCMGLTDPNSG